MRPIKYSLELAQEYSRLEEETLKENLAEADISFQENNTARAWKVVNKVTNRKARASGKLKGKTLEERTKQWFTHFEKLLGSQEDSETSTDIETGFIFEKRSSIDKLFGLQSLVRKCDQICLTNTHSLRFL